MTHGTDHKPPSEPPPATGSRVLDEPATVQTCASDYTAGAQTRHSSEQRDANARRPR